MKPEYKPLYEKFGLNVVYYRKSKKLTQLQLAELAEKMTNFFPNRVYFKKKNASLPIDEDF